jgi:hypothetical protein
MAAVLISEVEATLVDYHLMCDPEIWCCIFQRRLLAMWQKTELFIQQNVLLCDLTILFISSRLQRSQRLDNHWSLLEYNG